MLGQLPSARTRNPSSRRGPLGIETRLYCSPTSAGVADDRAPGSASFSQRTAAGRRTRMSVMATMPSDKAKSAANKAVPTRPATASFEFRNCVVRLEVSDRTLFIALFGRPFSRGLDKASAVRCGQPALKMGSTQKGQRRKRLRPLISFFKRAFSFQKELTYRTYDQRSKPVC